MNRHKIVDGVKIDLTAKEIAELDAQDLAWSKNKSKNNKKQAPYINQRKNAYPPIGDQLDMLWHSIDQNPKLKSEYFDFYETLKAVKVKYPKNG
tara:strand:- start:588 stop:869 length:282 start_codon:yes stop_codon:yes gene_type:complete